MAVTGAVSVQELGERSVLTASSISHAGLVSFSCLVLANSFTAQQYVIWHYASMRAFLLCNDFRFREPLTDTPSNGQCSMYQLKSITNARRMHARVIVVTRSVCVSACLCVCVSVTNLAPTYDVRATN